MPMLKCLKQDCGNEWNYQGKRKKYATCSDCKTPVKIPEGRAAYLRAHKKSSSTEE